MQHSGQDHRTLALWAADCAERVLPLFEATQPGDKRPRAAIAGVRSWARGNMAMAEARKRAFAAHDAAREAGSDAARQAARAAGHAAASAHVPSHAPHAANYALKAVIAAGGDDIAEERWQDESAPQAR